MAIDLAALRAKLAAQKAAAGAVQNTSAYKAATKGVTNETSNTTSNNVVAGTAVAVTGSSNSSWNTGSSQDVVPTVNAPAILGTSKTTEIEHLDFLSKMNSLAQAIHAQHPTMPVLLMQIHKQLRTDPELVTTLDEDAIGIIVRGLQIQTKTELVAEAVKKSSSGRTKKNPALSTDMF